MGLGGCYTCIKYLLVGFNVLFSVVGLALLAIGIWFRLDPNMNSYMEDDSIEMAHLGAYGCIVIGAIITVVGFFGCCGALRESQCLLVSFFISLAVIFMSLLGLAVRLFILKDMVSGTVRNFFKKNLDARVATYNTDRVSMEYMDAIQNQFDCCGSSIGAVDYSVVFQLPSSCSIINYATPCLDKIVPESYTTLIICIPIVFALPLLVGMMFAMMLCCAIRREGYSH
ncbi:CD9 antigen-like [Haliotis cracherodii]|uniref:CD9 antigen-like n=1 Tax=Haliotis cracherodii TaxID=6455 RepID=UPI0039EBBD13